MEKLRFEEVLFVAHTFSITYFPGIEHEILGFLYLFKRIQTYILRPRISH